MEIKDIIGKKGIFEMVYTKLDGTTTCYYIADVQLSGKDYIKAYSCKSPKQLTFKIERIWDVQETWIALNKGDVTPQSGVYVFVYEGDNHLDFEAFQLVKGEELLKYFVGEYSHGGFMDRLPFAYHYVEAYNPQMEQDVWIKPDGGDKDDDWYNYFYHYVSAIETPQGECGYLAGILSAGNYTLKAYHRFFDPRNACNWLMSEDYENYEDYEDYYCHYEDYDDFI